MPLPRLSHRHIKLLLAHLWTKETLVFSFFLLLSTIFWLLNKLSEQAEMTLSVPIKLVGIPPNIIVTDELPAHIDIVLSDRGNQLLYYRYALQRDTVIIPFSRVQTPSGNVSLSADSLVAAVHQQLAHSTKWSISPMRINFSYNYGSRKRVPIRFAGIITPSEDYYLTQQRFVPDSTTVYAPISILDTLTEIRTQPLRLTLEGDSMVYTVPLHKMPATRLVPNEAQLFVYADRLMDKQIEVIVNTRNVPDGYILRTFPTRLMIACQVGTQRYEQVSPNAIEVYVDYKDLRQGITTLPIRIGNLPTGIHRAKPSVASVEIVLERE
ncbi:MAG: hypothetical protein Q4A44_04005 [Bacteroidales bacterium]|nr:hypothetical protein [Bacteroidales bacterium]